MWFQQTPKMSQGELLTYIFTKNEREKQRENGPENAEAKRETEKKIAATV